MEENNQEVSPAAVLSDKVTNTVQARNIDVVVRAIKKNEPGFMPLWKRVLSIKRGIADFEKAQPEDVDEAYEFLCSVIVEPSTQAAKMDLLNSITNDEMMALFSAVIGGGVPPSKGGA